MEVSWNGATPKSSILDWDFPLTNDFGDPPFMETPMLPATGFLTSYQPQFHQKSRCSTAKFQVLPKVQWLSHHFKFQVPSKGSGTSKFQVLHYLIMEKSSVPSCRNLVVRKWWKPPTSTGESSCSPIHMPCLRIFSDIFCFTNSTGWSSITDLPACSLLTCHVFRGYLGVQLRIIINKN